MFKQRTRIRIYEYVHSLSLHITYFFHIHSYVVGKTEPEKPRDRKYTTNSNEHTNEKLQGAINGIRAF